MALAPAGDRQRSAISPDAEFGVSRKRLEKPKEAQAVLFQLRPPHRRSLRSERATGQDLGPVNKEFRRVTRIGWFALLVRHRTNPPRPRRSYGNGKHRLQRRTRPADGRLDR